MLRLRYLNVPYLPKHSACVAHTLNLLGYASLRPSIAERSRVVASCTMCCSVESSGFCSRRSLTSPLYSQAQNWFLTLPSRSPTKPHLAAFSRSSAMYCEIDWPLLCVQRVNNARSKIRLGFLSKWPARHLTASSKAALGSDVILVNTLNPSTPRLARSSAAFWSAYSSPSGKLQAIK